MFLGIRTGLPSLLRATTSDMSFLFRNGEQGVWYSIDPEYMWQDSAGTTPVTAPNQPVGLRLDRSRGVTVTDDGQGGRVLSGLGDELVTNGDFEDGSTGWNVLSGWEVTGGHVVCDTSGGTGSLSQAAILEVGKTYQITVDVDVQSGTGVKLEGSAGVNLASLNVSGAGQRYIFTAGLPDLVFRRIGDTVTTLDNISVREIPGTHMIQDTNDDFRPTYTIDDNGFGCLTFDGIDDYMETSATLDMSASDEVTAWAAVHKADDSIQGNIFEHGTNEITMEAPTSALGDYGFTTKSVELVSVQPAPTSSTLVGLGKISTDTAVFRIDGSEVASSAADQGTGNYGNHSLTVGGFNGSLYSFGLRGALTEGDQLNRLEGFIKEPIE